MIMLTVGSVRPHSSEAIGLKWRGRKLAAAAIFLNVFFARAIFVNGTADSSGNSGGVWLIDSAPPASTARASPPRTAADAWATASIPLAQLRWTVSAGIACGTPAQIA